MRIRLETSLTLFAAPALTLLLACGQADDPAPVLDSPAEAGAKLGSELDIELLRDPTLPADARVLGAQGLADDDSPEATEALLEALDDPSADVVLAAVEALAQRDDPRIEPALAGLRSHPDPRVTGALE